MYVVLGASGNTGHVVAKALLSNGQKVRAFGRNASHLQSLAAEGAEIFTGDVTDSGALAKAFQQADSAYVMIPPNTTTKDYRAFQDQARDAIANAVRNAGIQNIVTLSSLGAEKTSGTGPVVGLHNLEQELNQISGANILHLRAGYFMENTLPQVGAIRMMGSAAGPVRPDLKLQMIASRDIGMIAAQALLGLAFRGKQTQELHGQRDIDYTEAASIIGNAIGKPNLAYIQTTDSQFKAAVAQIGMSEDMAGLILEMAGAINSGHMRALEPRTASNTTPTRFETFVTETFLPAYQQQAAA
ncbi:MAG: NmrA family NAD(P)-binding protein [Terriglobales bacterium]